MTEHTFKIGDVVRLVSGGPRMCVEGGTMQSEVAVVWFDDRGCAMRGRFSPRVLVTASPPPGDER